VTEKRELSVRITDKGVGIRKYTLVVPWRKQLFASPSEPRRRFNPKPVYIMFLVDKLVLAAFFP
jgi:hypothetical protein